MQVHELGMYYLVTLGVSSPLRDKARTFSGIEDDLLPHEGLEPLKLIYQWFPLDSLAEVLLYPSFLRTRLSMLPATTELVMHTDTEDHCVAG